MIYKHVFTFSFSQKLRTITHLFAYIFLFSYLKLFSLMLSSWISLD